MSKFSIYAQEGLFQILIFGFGISAKDLNRHRLYFSERKGYTKHFEILNWSFSFVHPRRAHGTTRAKN